MIYEINYRLFDANSSIIKQGIVRIKNRPNEFIAKCDLESHLKRKYPSMYRMTVDRCEPYTPPNIFDFFRGFAQ